MSESLPTGLSANLFELPLGVIAHAASEAIVVVDQQQRIVALNPAAQRMFLCSPASVLGQPLACLIPAPARATHEAHVREFQDSGTIERPMRTRRPITGLRSDGQEFPADATISRIELAIDGELRPFFVALLRDMSQEQALHDEVEALGKRFRTVLDLSPVAMWITDGDHVAFANRAAFELFGVRPGDHLVGRPVFTLLRPESHAALREQMVTAVAGAAPPVVAGSIARFDGASREVEIAAAGLPDHGRSVMQMVITDVTQRQQLVREQTRHREALRRLSASVVEAREEERRRIARELHDELGQRLTALKMELSSLASAKGPRSDETRIANMLEMIDDTVASVRRIAADLRPMMLDDLGLNAAIEWLARDAARRLDMEITVRLSEEDPPVTQGAAIALYRMVQEALTNVARHARATEVNIEMRQEGGELVLTVRDNGVGFPADLQHNEGRYGLLGIRERAYMLGGRLEVDNPPGGGGRLTVRLPLQAAGSVGGGEEPTRTPR